MPETALILLAAGNSSRMGAAKQLLDLGGKPLLRRAAENALASASRPVIVVTGSRADEMRKALEGLPVEFADNPHWEHGMGTSIRTGIAALSDRRCAGAILALADQPLITPAIYDNLVEVHLQTAKAIVASRYLGTVGVPVFFSRDYFSPLQNLPPAQGCKGVILSHQSQAAEVECPEAGIDIDTPEDYRRILALESFS